MITHRRANERHHDQHRNQKVWRTFNSDISGDVLANGFGSLEIFDEDHLSPGTSIPRHPRHDAEILTYVHEGALAYEDSTGRTGVICAGEFQRRTAARGVRHSETNASRADWAHVFQIWMRPWGEVGLEPSHIQKRFSAAERRGVLCAVASPDSRKGSLFIHQDVVMYSALLDPGQHVVHELAEGRSAWLHIVVGEVTYGDIVLCTGDGVGVSAERAISLTAKAQSEILLLDLGQHLGKSPKLGLA